MIALPVVGVKVDASGTISIVTVETPQQPAGDDLDRELRSSRRSMRIELKGLPRSPPKGGRIGTLGVEAHVCAASRDHPILSLCALAT